MIRSLSLASFFLLFIATFANAITYDLIDLGTLGEYSTASSINDHGQAVGYSINADGNERAVLYDNGGVQDLGTLGGWSRANDINNSGQIVGTSLYGRDEHGFL